jgi:hypothetical protein
MDIAIGPNDGLALEFLVNLANSGTCAGSLSDWQELSPPEVEGKVFLAYNKARERAERSLKANFFMLRVAF